MRVIPLLFIPGVLSVKNSFNIRKAFGRPPFVLIGLAFWIFIYVIFSKVLQYFKGVEVFGDILSAKLFSMEAEKWM